MICCDTCPYYPTCEEVEDFERDALGLHDDWGDDGHELERGDGE